MNIIEIITDSLMYPINNLNAVLIYAVIGIIAALVLVFTGVGISVGAAANNLAVSGIVGIIGIIIAVVLFLLIDGYALDIIKYGIARNNGAPTIDFARQIINGIKLFIVSVVYFIIPVLILFAVGLVFAQWIAQIVFFILFIIFGLAGLMASCRLAETGSLNSALSIADAVYDILSVGVLKIIVTLLVIGILSGILTGIANAISGFSNVIGAILLGIFAVYLAFASYRSAGLLYSDRK